MKQGPDVPGWCSEPHAASHASANQWANKLEMHTRTHVHTFLPSPVPLPSIMQGLWTWQGGKEPLETGWWALGLEICLSLLYFLSPQVPIWPADPPLQLALPTMCVLPDHCPPHLSVKTRLLGLQRVLNGQGTGFSVWSLHVLQWRHGSPSGASSYSPNPLE